MTVHLHPDFTVCPFRTAITHQFHTILLESIILTVHSCLKVLCTNPYTETQQAVILARDLVPAYFTKKMEGTYEVTGQSWRGDELVGIRYEQLIPWVKPDGDAFRVIAGDYVTTSDGTGIVHIAPTFGADDARVARAADIPPLFMVDKAGKNQPMVDRQGRFFLLEDLDPEFVRTHVDRKHYTEYAGRYVKNAYDDKLTDADLINYMKPLWKRAGFDQTAIDGLTVAYLKGLNDTANNMGVSSLIWEIRRLRRCELMLDDGIRYWDLIRWHQLELLDTNKYPNVVLGVNVKNAPIAPARVTGNYLNGSFGSSRTFDNKYYLYPIPSEQTQLNPKLGQNEGWK